MCSLLGPGSGSTMLHCYWHSCCSLRGEVMIAWTQETDSFTDCLANGKWKHSTNRNIAGKLELEYRRCAWVASAGTEDLEHIISTHESVIVSTSVLRKRYVTMEEIVVA
jgi:hypothetical protein